MHSQFVSYTDKHDTASMCEFMLVS